MKSKITLVLAVSALMGFSACTQPQLEPIKAEPVAQKY